MPTSVCSLFSTIRHASWMRTVDPQTPRMRSEKRANVLATAQQQQVEPGSRLAAFIECLIGGTQPEELVASR